MIGKRRTSIAFTVKRSPRALSAQSTAGRVQDVDGNGDGGFTLIELLAVIAVLAVLGAILIAAVGKVRASARSAETVSNLRQVTQGYLLLIQNGGGETEVFRGGGGGADRIWSVQLAEMGVGAKRGDGRKVFYPADKAEDAMGQSAWPWYTFGLRMFGDNVEIDDVETDGGGSYQLARINYAGVEDPANHLLFANTVWPGRSDYASGELLGSFRLTNRNANTFVGLHKPESADGVAVSTMDGAVTIAGKNRLEGLGINSVFVGSKEDPVAVENLP